MDCTAEWVHEVEKKWRGWDVHKSIRPPLGFDPTPHYGTIEHKHFGLLKFTPWQIELAGLWGESLSWRTSSDRNEFRRADTAET